MNLSELIEQVNKMFNTGVGVNLVSTEALQQLCSHVETELINRTTLAFPDLYEDHTG